MCGIAGVVSMLPDIKDTVEKLITLQSHRGPDGPSFFVDEGNGVALGFNRLSIVDLRDGIQPIIDNEVVVIFNGEIFNYKEIYDEMLTDGIIINGSITEVSVIAELYKSEGIDFLNKLNGMFVISIFDRVRKILIVARDRFGIKPLFYSRTQNNFTFASEITPLKLIARSLPISEQQLRNFFTLGYIPSPFTIFKEIFQLEPASYIEFDCTTFQLKKIQWYTLAYQKDYVISQEEAAEQLALKLRNSSKLWAYSEVPISFQLSGGIDSALLAAIESKSSIMPVSTYTLGLKDADLSRWDERALSKISAKQINSINHEVILHTGMVRDEITNIVRHLGQPYAGGIPSWFIFKEISKSFKVSITGTGADEIFGNYNRACFFSDRGLHENSGILSYEDFARFMREKLSINRNNKIEKILSEEVMSSTSPTEELMYEEFKNIRKRSFDLSDAISLFCMRFQLADEFLLMTDQLSMAHGVEARTPYLDHTLVEFAFTVPENIKSNESNYKKLLKKVAEDYLPNEVISAPKKGFSLPYSFYMRGEINEDFISSTSKLPYKSDSFIDDIIYPMLSGNDSQILTNWAGYMAAKSLANLP
jgi:asparagine synthase (glutamine-hydrolysing)